MSAKSGSSMQPAGKRKPRAKAKPEIGPAPRIAGVKARGKAAGLSLVGLSEAKKLPSMTAKERKAMLAWRDRVETLAQQDPEAYAEACRSGKQL